MAKITTYATLKANLKTWLERGSELDTDIPTMIQLFEAKAQRRWRDVTSLTAEDSNNWLLTSHPDVYLYGSLVEAAPYLKEEDDRLAAWKALYDEAAAQVVYADAEANFDDYDGLKRSISMVLRRPDLDTEIPLYIKLAEARLKRDPRVRDQSCNGTWTITADGDAVPDDWGTMQSWAHDGPTYFGAIFMVGLDLIPTKKAEYGETGVPRYAAISDGRMYYAPEPDGTYSTKLSYLRKLTALSASNTSNWLFAAHPDIYLYASLVEAGVEDPRKLEWESKLEVALEKLRLMNWEESWGGGTVRRLPRTVIGG